MHDLHLDERKKNSANLEILITAINLILTGASIFAARSANRDRKAANAEAEG